MGNSRESRPRWRTTPPTPRQAASGEGSKASPGRATRLLLPAPIAPSEWALQRAAGDAWTEGEAWPHPPPSRPRAPLPPCLPGEGLSRSPSRSHGSPRRLPRPAPLWSATATGRASPAASERALRNERRPGFQAPALDRATDTGWGRYPADRSRDRASLTTHQCSKMAEKGRLVGARGVYWEIEAVSEQTSISRDLALQLPSRSSLFSLVALKTHRDQQKQKLNQEAKRLGFGRLHPFIAKVRAVGINGRRGLSKRNIGRTQV